MARRVAVIQKTVQNGVANRVVTVDTAVQHKVASRVVILSRLRHVFVRNVFCVGSVACRFWVDLRLLVYRGMPIEPQKS